MANQNKKRFKIDAGMIIIFVLVLFFAVTLFYGCFRTFISFGGDSAKIRYKDAEISELCKEDGDNDIMSTDFKFRATFVNMTDEDLKNVKAVATIKTSGSIDDYSSIHFKEIELPTFDIEANSEYRMIFSVDYNWFYNVYGIEASIDGGKTFDMKQADFWSQEGISGLCCFVGVIGLVVIVILGVLKVLKKNKELASKSQKKVVGIKVVGDENDEYPVYEDGTLGEKNTSGYIAPNEASQSNIKCPNCGYENNSSAEKCEACGSRLK